MEHVEVEEIEIVSDISEGYSNSREPIRGVRNGSLPPFVTKLYDMVSNKTTNSTISWVGATSFVILNEQNFINNLLPKMSKSNKFDSFISQLNIYVRYLILGLHLNVISYKQIFFFQINVTISSFLEFVS